VVERRSHVVLDPDSRLLKAEKIVLLLDQRRPLRRMRILEVGCGSGHIASELRVEGTALPYPENSFDVVVSNHVLEYVGGEEKARHHLGRIARVLEPTGTAYVAVPSRWILVEPKYRLPLLSWLSPSLRTPYLRVTGRAPITTAMLPRDGRSADSQARRDSRPKTSPSTPCGRCGLSKLRQHHFVRPYTPRFLLTVLRPASPMKVFRLRPGRSGT
jgi:hypothetical protein